MSGVIDAIVRAILEAMVICAVITAAVTTALIFGIPWLWALLKPLIHSITG